MPDDVGGIGGGGGGAFVVLGQNRNVSDTLTTAFRDDDAYLTTGGRLASTLTSLVTYTAPTQPPPPVTRLPGFTLVACARDGSPIAAPLRNASDRLIERQVIMGGETPNPGHATFTLPITDPANSLIFPGVTRLKAYLNTALVWHGKIMVKRPQLEDGNERVEYEAFDMLEQLSVLEIDPLLRGRVGWSDTHDAIVQRIVTRVNSDVLADPGLPGSLIDIGQTNNPYEGASELVMGDTAGSGYRNVAPHWDTGTNLLDVLASLTAGPYGVEIIATPTEGQVSYDAYSGQYVEAITQLDVYPPRGAGVTQPDLILSYRGHAPTNLASVTYEEDARYVVNVAIETGTTIGKYIRAGVAQDATSRRRYGTRHLVGQQNEAKTTTGLVTQALADLEPTPPFTVTATPLGNAPVAFRDYGLGDTLPIQISSPLDPATGQRTLDVFVTARAVSLSLGLDENDVPTQSPLVYTSNAGTGRRTIPRKDEQEIAHWRSILRRLKRNDRKNPDAITITDDDGTERIRIGRQDDGTITIREL